MTNRLALALAVLVIAFLAFDHYAFDGGMSVFLARKLVDLTTYIAFWR